MPLKTARASSLDRIWILGFLLLLLGFGVLLATDPGADPPLGPNDLEGQLVIGARSAAEESEFPLGQWDPFLISPTHLSITSLLFRATGPSLIAARAVAAAAAVLVVLLFYALVRRMTGPGTALLAAVFLMVNALFFAVSRTALPAVFSLLWMLVVIRVWLWGSRNRAAAFAAGFLLIWAGLIENGPDNYFFLGAGTLTALFVRLHAWKMPWVDVVRARLGVFWVGAGFGVVVFLVRAVRHWDAFGPTWGHFPKGGFRDIAANSVMAPVYLGGMVERMPVITVLALLYFLFFAKKAIRPVARHRRLDEVRLWFLGWLLCGTAAFVITAAPPLTVLVLLVPPICVLAAEGITQIFRQRTFTHPKMDVMIASLLIAGSVWFGCAWAVRTYYGRLGLEGFWSRHEIQGALILVIGLWIALTSLAVWLYLKVRAARVPLHPIPVVAATALLAVGAVVLGVRPHAAWWTARSHQVSEAGALLSGLTEQDLVVGSWAPLLTLELPARSTVVWNGVNDREEDWHGEVTHFLLAEGNEHREDRGPVRPFLNRGWTMEPARPARLAVGGKTLRLYRVVR